MPVLALALMQGACPMTIGIGKDGAIFTGRFYGWYRTSPNTLKGDLKGGCYNDSHPHIVTSVKLVIAAGALKPRVDLVYSILQEEGWPREKLQVESWDKYPQNPK